MSTRTRTRKRINANSNDIWGVCTEEDKPKIPAATSLTISVDEGTFIALMISQDIVKDSHHEVGNF